MYLRNIQITATEDYEDFEEYTEKTYNIYLDEPLRKVGDYADYIDFKEQKVVRKVFASRLSNIELTGKSAATTSNNFYESRWYTSHSLKHKPNILLSDNTTFSNNPLVLCENLPSLSWNQLISSKNIYGISVTESKDENRSNEIRIVLPESIATTVTGAAEWLQNNDSDVYYVYLDKYIKEEKVSLPNILVNEGTNVVSIGTLVSPSSIKTIHYTK